MVLWRRAAKAFLQSWCQLVGHVTEPALQHGAVRVTNWKHATLRRNDRNVSSNGNAQYRTHSIVRVASTASPVSGADVRERVEEVRLMLKVENSVALIARTWRKYSQGEEGAE
eukprot:scaffold3267_cov66-Skeletonema_marinoi.AAC.3